MLSDIMINGKAFTALKYTLAIMAMLAKGLEKTLLGRHLFSFQVIWARKL